MKTCGKCKQTKKRAEFALSKKKGDGLQSWCKSCKKQVDSTYYRKNYTKMRLQSRAANAKRRKENKAYLEEYKRSKCCIDCGESNPIVFEFDHVRGTKVSNISTLAGWATIALLEEEIAKCVIRCCNCHRIQTHLRRNMKRKLQGGAAGS